MRAPLLLIPLAVEWLILVTTIVPLFFPGRLRSYPQLAISMWFLALMSAAVAAGAAIAVSLWSVVDTWLSLRNGQLQNSPATFILVSFGPWIFLATAGISIALVNLRIEPLVSSAKSSVNKLDFALTKISTYRQAVVYEFALSQVFALSMKSNREARILVSSGAMQILDSEELKAVLAHEHAHLSLRHNELKKLARFIRALAPRLAASAALVAELEILCEFAADKKALRKISESSLRSAQAKFSNQLS